MWDFFCSKKQKLPNSHNSQLTRVNHTILLKVHPSTKTAIIQSKAHNLTRIFITSRGDGSGLFEKLGSIEFSIAEMYSTGSISKVNIIFYESK